MVNRKRLEILFFFFFCCCFSLFIYVFLFSLFCLFFIECMDFGYPQITAINILTSYIKHGDVKASDQVNKYIERYIYESKMFILFILYIFIFFIFSMLKVVQVMLV
jgi:hypothetical protein